MKHQAGSHRSTTQVSASVPPNAAASDFQLTSQPPTKMDRQLPPPLPVKMTRPPQPKN